MNKEYFYFNLFKNETDENPYKLICFYGTEDELYQGLLHEKVEKVKDYFKCNYFTYSHKSLFNEKFENE